MQNDDDDNDVVHVRPSLRLSAHSVQVTRVSCRGPATMTELVDLMADRVIVAWKPRHLSPVSANLLFSSSIDCQLIAGFAIALPLDVNPSPSPAYLSSLLLIKRKKC